MQRFPTAKEHLVVRPTDGNGKTVFISPNFECGVVEVLRDDEAKLTNDEIKSLIKLERRTQDATDDEDLSFADVCERAAEQKASNYKNLHWISGTSNKVKRLSRERGSF